MNSSIIARANRHISAVHKRVATSANLRKFQKSGEFLERRAINQAFIEMLPRLPKTSEVVAFRKLVDKVVKEDEASREQLLQTGTCHWFDPRMKINDPALELGYSLLISGDRMAASMLSDAMLRTGAQGKKLLHFAATVSAANREWGRAGQLFKRYRLAKGEEAVRPSPERWEYNERLFAKIADYAAQAGLNWLDMGPYRTQKARMDSLETLIQAWIRSGQIAMPSCRPLLEYFGDLGRTSLAEMSHMADPHGVRSMKRSGFRNYVAGKRVCLVANSRSLLDENLGPLIDSYDVVIRFNSFVIDPPHTGTKISVHACIHLYDFNLAVPVDVRIMVSGKKDLWMKSVHEKIVPGAQRWLGDASLRWPARDLKLITEKTAVKTPTVGFNIMRLLHHYEVCAALDLIGFDFYESGMLRVEAAMSIAHSQAHNSVAERDWTLANARKVSGNIISMI